MWQGEGEESSSEGEIMSSVLDEFAVEVELCVSQLDLCVLVRTVWTTRRFISHRYLYIDENGCDLSGRVRREASHK